MYTITLHDGTTLANLQLNGDNFIADTIISDDVFTDNLDTVTVTDGTTTYNCTDMALVCNRAENGRSWIVLREKTPQEKADEARAKEISDLRKALNETMANRLTALETKVDGDLLDQAAALALLGVDTEVD